MSAQTLTLTYQAAEIDRITDPYWIRIEPVGQEPETATVSDAANLLDALYQIDPCTESEDQGQLVEQEDYAPTVAATIDLSYCDQAYDGSVEMDIRIIRSHLAEPYRLQLQGGELIQTLQVSEQVTRTLAISGPTTLDYPVVGGFACSPEPLARVGNTLLFEADLDGQTLRATYQTRYALATIKVLGVDGQPGECRALAFHHGLVADEILTPPEAEQVDRSLCPSTSYESPESEDEVTCYQEVVVHRVCSCSKHEIETLRYEEIVPCPGEMHCANNETRCMHLVGTASATTYVSCGDQDRSGDFDGNLSDPEFYFDKCCEWPRRGLPQCVTEHRTYRGERQLIHGPEHYRGLYGALTRIVPVSPPGGICGDWTIEQRLMGNNCCDGVDPLVWDTDTSPETMPPSTRVLVAVLGGGRFPVTWTVSGRGFWLDPAHTTRSVIAGSQVWLYADADACGCCDITATDGCTRVQGLVRCTVGRWQVLGDFSPIYAYKPDEHGFFQEPVNGYSGAIAGSGDRYAGRYRLSDSGTGDPGGGWTWSTWTVYSAPDGRSGHWARCFPGPAGTAIDPIVGVFEIDTIHHYDEIPEHRGCDVFLRTAWILDRLYVHEWVC